MGFLDMLKSWIKPEDMSYEDIMKQRSKIKTDMANILRERDFTEMEINEVLLIVTDTEKKIEQLKREISRLATSHDDPTARIKELREEIDKETIDMNQKIKAKAEEISSRKQSRLDNQ